MDENVLGCCSGDPLRRPYHALEQEVVPVAATDHTGKKSSNYLSSGVMFFVTLVGILTTLGPTG